MLLYVFDMLGVVSFAVAGALIAMKKRLDIFGVIFLAVITATGGGIIRDVLIGEIPPISLVDHKNIAVSSFTAIIMFFIYSKFHKIKNIILIFDAFGLGIFTAVGSQKAMELNKGLLIVIICGMTTAVGGGIIRDTLAGRIPDVFKKEIYASAAIVGSIIFYYSHKVLGTNLSMYIVTFITIGIRMYAMKNKLSLPSIKEDINRHLMH